MMIANRLNHKHLTLTVLVLLFGTTNLIAEELIHFKINNKKNELILEVLKLALSKTSPQTTFADNGNDNSNHARSIRQVQSDNLDVFWAGTTPIIEEQLLAIRIPVLKGLLGHRIFIIRRGQQSKFDGITTLAQLKQLKAGQGVHWGDTLILKDSGLSVVTTSQFELLFPMLVGNRFDYFPRALHEPWSELREFGQFELSIEENILLIYPFPMYFYVAKNNHALAQKIEQGFNQAIKDGSYDQLFFNHPLIKEALSRANLKNRLVIRLPNKMLSPETPLNVKEYWLNPQELD